MQLRCFSQKRLGIKVLGRFWSHIHTISVAHSYGIRSHIHTVFRTFTTKIFHRSVQKFFHIPPHYVVNGAPHPTAVESLTPRAPEAPEPPRGEMRRRIVALLQEHPEGLSPAQTRQLLGVDKNLSDTMGGMARDGLLRRVKIGRYGVLRYSPC